MLIYFNVYFPLSRTFLERLITMDVVGISMSLGVSFLVSKAPATPILSLSFCLQQVSTSTNSATNRRISDQMYEFLMNVSHSNHHRYLHVWTCYECKYFFPTGVMWLKIISNLKFHFLIIMKTFQCSHMQSINSSEMILDTPLLLSTINLFAMLFKLL